MSWPGLRPVVDRKPRAIGFIRASEIAQPRGRRVMIGHQSFGWRGDLRADTPVSHQGGIYVPVLVEQDWYRAEAEQVEVFAPLIPIARVWVESLDFSSDEDLAVPAPRIPRPVTNEPDFVGRRIVFMPDEERDLRAVSNTKPEETGIDCVLVAQEADWYQWAWSGKMPRVRSLPASDLWIE